VGRSGSAGESGSGSGVQQTRVTLVFGAFRTAIHDGVYSRVRPLHANRLVRSKQSGRERSARRSYGCLAVVL
jgi:hypothetical protein